MLDICSCCSWLCHKVFRRCFLLSGVRRKSAPTRNHHCKNYHLLSADRIHHLSSSSLYHYCQSRSYWHESTVQENWSTVFPMWRNDHRVPMFLIGFWFLRSRLRYQTRGWSPNKKIRITRFRFLFEEKSLSGSEALKRNKKLETIVPKEMKQEIPFFKWNKAKHSDTIPIRYCE